MTDDRPPLYTRVVYKYAFPTGITTLRIRIPYASVPRHFAAQHELLTVWVEQPTPALDREQTFEFIIRGTGNELPAIGPWSYIGSTLVAGGDYVFHCYYRMVD